MIVINEQRVYPPNLVMVNFFGEIVSECFKNK